MQPENELRSSAKKRFSLIERFLIRAMRHLQIMNHSVRIRDGVSSLPIECVSTGALLAPDNLLAHLCIGLCRVGLTQ